MLHLFFCFFDNNIILIQKRLKTFLLGKSKSKTQPQQAVGYV